MLSKSFSVPLAFALTLVSLPAWVQTTMPVAETLFKNVRVFDGTNGALSAPTNVLIRGNKVAVIGTSAQSSSATVIEGGPAGR